MNQEEKKVIKRGKGKIQNCLTLKDIYKEYIKGVEKTSKFNVDSKTFKSICHDFNKLMMYLIIEEGYFFKLPYRLGTIRIKKRKLKIGKDILKPDFGAYNKSNGQHKLKILNEHSDGYYFRFYWSKVNAVIINKALYSFTPTRANKRYLAKTIKENGLSQINKIFE